MLVLFSGWLYDVTSYYPASLQMAGASLLMSALILVPVWWNERKFKLADDKLYHIDVKIVECEKVVT